MPAKRSALLLPVLLMVPGLSACVGDTDPADKISSYSARLNAHGRTNDGPAKWWWEYSTVKANLGTASDKEVCGSLKPVGVAPDARCGPASVSTDVPLSFTLTELTADTTYYFRACGQDTNKSSPSCGNTLSFKTKPVSNGYTIATSAVSPGSGNGQSNSLAGVATDYAGNVYLADSANNRVQKLRPDLTFERKWGSLGSTDGKFNKPVGIDVDGTGNVYVADQGNARIQKFDSSGGFLKSWPTRHLDSGYTLDGVAVDDATGRVYTSSRCCNAGVGEDLVVERFTTSGEFVTSWDVPNSYIDFMPTYITVRPGSGPAVSTTVGGGSPPFFPTKVTYYTPTGGLVGSTGGDFDQPFTGVAYDVFSLFVGVSHRPGSSFVDTGFDKYYGLATPSLFRAGKMSRLGTWMPTASGTSISSRQAPGGPGSSSTSRSSGHGPAAR